MRHVKPNKYPEGFIQTTTKATQSTLTAEERDDRLKNLLCIIYWLVYTGYDCLSIVDSYKNLDLSHIKGKKAHPELRYDLENVQLAERQGHRKAHDTGEYVDMRNDKIKAIMKFINFTQGD
jgi:5-methylcytosine-specific restriction endonuclease McrA